MEQDDVIEVYQEQTGGGFGWDTLEELPEEFFEIEARGPGDSRTLITVLPGMDYGDLKSEYCRKVMMCDESFRVTVLYLFQADLSYRMLSFSLWSFQKKKLLNEVRDDTPLEWLEISPKDVLRVQSASL